MHRGFANPKEKKIINENRRDYLILSLQVTYYSVNGHPHFVRENFPYGPPILLRTAEEKRQVRDEIHLKDNLQESMYENDGTSMLGVMMVLLCRVGFARLDFVIGKRNSFLSQ